MPAHSAHVFATLSVYVRTWVGRYLQARGLSVINKGRIWKDAEQCRVGIKYTLFGPRYPPSTYYAIYLEALR